MKVLNKATSALLLGSVSVLGSEILFTTVRINTAICTPTGGGGNGGNSTNLVIENPVFTAFGSYSFTGFYPIPNQGTILKRAVSNAETSGTMTPGECGDFCKGSTYFEVQNGDECFCGNDSPTGIAINSADPETPCAGNKTEVCGAPGYGAVYQKDSTSSSSPAQTTSPVTSFENASITTTADTLNLTSTQSSLSASSIADTSGASSSSSSSTSYYMGLSIPSSSSLTSSSVGNGTATPSISTPVESESVQSQTYTTNGSICFGLSCVPETVTGRTGVDSSATSATSTGGPSSSNGTSASATTGGFSSSTSVSTSASSTVGPLYPCPALNGQEYINDDGVGYDIVCNTDYVGLPSPNDLPATDARTFAQCIADCDNYVPDSTVENGASCVAVTFGIGGTSACYLKFVVTTIQGSNPGYDSAKLHSYNPQGVSSTSASSTSGSTSSIGGSSSISGSSSSSAASSSSSGGVTSSSASSGGSSSSYSVSHSNSASSTSSVSSTTGASSSVSRSSTSSVVTSSTAASTTSTSASNTYTFDNEPTGIVPPTCGNTVTSNNTIYTDIFGYPYYVKCGLNIVGDNAYPAHADTFPKCLEYCDLLVGCAAITYLDGAASTDSNCFPYSSFTGYSSGPAGVYTGIPKNGTSDGAIQASPDLCAADPTGYNQSVYSDYFGNDYFIGCNQNVAGSGPPGGQDLKATVADTLLGCLTYCSTYNTCVGVDFTGFPVQQNAANCYPKFSTGAVTYQPGTQMAYMYD